MPNPTVYRAWLTPCVWPLIAGLFTTAACAGEGADATENPLAPGNPSAAATGTVPSTSTPGTEGSNGVNADPNLPQPAVSAGPDGKNASATFGTVVTARDARINQLSLKFIF